MRRVIEGKIYDTDTAERICDLRCTAQRSDFGWHQTALYRSPKGRYFIAGTGGPLSIWGIAVAGGMGAGDGIRVLTVKEAMQYAEAAELDPEAMTAAGFTVEEG